MPHLTMADMASRTMAKKKNWVKKATANAHGQFRAKAEAAGKSTSEFAKEHDADSGKTGKQARLAETLMGMNKSKKLYTHPRSMKG
jgi:hypothetical protein